MRYAAMFTIGICHMVGAEHNPDEVLMRAIQKTLASAREIPNYTCVETVSRE